MLGRHHSVHPAPVRRLRYAAAVLAHLERRRRSLRALPPRRATRREGGGRWAVRRVLRDILHVFKYGRRPTLAAPLGERLRRQGGDLLDAADGVVPVPLHPRRRRERGFNQAELLARELGRPVLQVLARTRETGTQASLPEAQRHRNVRDAFARTGADIRGLSLVLVDDVATTGATLEACARVLMAAGAREVAALTVARAERRLP